MSNHELQFLVRWEQYQDLLREAAQRRLIRLAQQQPDPEPVKPCLTHLGGREGEATPECQLGKGAVR